MRAVALLTGWLSEGQGGPGRIGVSHQRESHVWALVRNRQAGVGPEKLTIWSMEGLGSDSENNSLSS